MLYIQHFYGLGTIHNIEEAGQLIVSLVRSHDVDDIIEAQPCSQDGDTRLLNFTSDVYAGFVEVCLDGTWGTICADSPTTLWSGKNAQVFCIGLGYSGALNSVNQSTLPSAYLINNGLTINYRAVECDGTEAVLSQCSHSTNTTECDHTYDAVVVCRQTTEDGDVRLVGSIADGQGAVEIYDQKTSQWYHVCPSPWFTFVALVVCKQLGYEFGSNYTLDLNGSSLQQVSVTICTSSRCYITSGTSCPAPSPLSAAVICSNSNGDSTFDKRLGGSSVFGEGRLEIYYNGVWGTICNNNGWTSADAQGVCRIVVGGNASSATVGPAAISADSASLKPIWLSGVTCNINSSSCNYKLPVGYGQSCNHSNDVMLYCYGLPTPAPPPASDAFPLPVLGVLGVIPVCVLIGLFAGWRWRRRRAGGKDVSTREDTVLYTKIKNRDNHQYSSIEPNI